MRRSVTELIRRGFDSALTNWQVILLRVGEMLLAGAIAIGLVIAILVPVLVSAGISHIDWKDVDSVQEGLMAFLTANWWLLLWIFVAISIALLVFVALHSFVEAGAARIFLDADRRAGDGVVAQRERFAAFSMERWLDGAKRGWWTVFWIYNIVWGIAGLILIAPLLVLLALMLVLGNATASIVLGCLGLVLALMLAFVIAIVTNIVCVKAILDAGAYSLTAGDAVRRSWQEVRSDVGRHVAIMAILILVSFAVAGVFSTASMGFTFHKSMSLALFFAPVRIIIQIANTIVSSFIANWMFGSFAAMIMERRS
ncbi:MAG: hypothetical protein JOZ54_06680 [Acidobacteria bacterium]|nr:hypothetical protein [Acidobacteriota bacterium]